MVETLPLEAFFDLPGVMVDVRAPCEFTKGHIPGSVNLPLLSDDERARVGTAYKQEGRTTAVHIGFECVGPKMAPLTRSLEEYRDQWIKVLCWRGGLRSGWMAWILEQAGYNVAVLEGGYKTFRRFALDALEVPKPVIVIGGLTGSGKTEVLHALGARGNQVIDLEALASHRGSVFGHLGQPPQPTQEQFENSLALKWHNLDPDKNIYFEDESRLVGRCVVPPEVFQSMRQAPLIFLGVPYEERLARILRDYGSQPIEEQRAATFKLAKKLGGLRMREALDAFDAGNVREAWEIILTYYDKTYRHSLDQRETMTTLQDSGIDAFQWAERVEECYQSSSSGVLV